LEGFLDANAATLEAVLALGGRLALFAWQRSLSRQTTRIVSPTWWLTPKVFDSVRQHPGHRLQYLYSLAIRLSYAAGERNRELWKVADLLVTHDEEERIAIDRALDTNTLVAIVLRFSMQDRSEIMEGERKKIFFKSLEKAVVHTADWRTRWKSIYLVADLLVLLSQTSIQREEKEQMKPLIDAAGKTFEEVKHEPVPSDWERKKDGLILCHKLEANVKNLVARVGTGEAIYKWSGPENIPYLSLYNPPHTTYLVAAMAMLQQ